MDQQKKQAIVIGASIAGLCAAAVLSEHFDRVTIIERDAYPEGASDHRKGVPQGRHTHILLRAGETILENIFPNIMDELRQKGARHFDATEGLLWFHYGKWKKKHCSGFMVHQQSRPLLENQILKRLVNNPRITFLRGYAAKQLLWSQNKKTVTGLMVEPTRATAQMGKQAKTLKSELIIDASGRASILTKWLQKAAYETPKETRVGMDLQYSSRVFQAPITQIPTTQVNQTDWQAFAVYPAPPQETRGGVLFKVEENKYILTLVGYIGDHPPKQNEGFLDFAKTLPVPDLYQQVKNLTPLSDVVIYRYPYARRLHFENIKQHPQGIVALGDAVCSFDPVFGQGMSVALQEVELLQQQLQSGKWQEKRFYQQVSKKLFLPWMLASMEDFRYPSVTGKRPVGLTMMQNYFKKIFLLSAKSEFVYAQLMRVFHMDVSPFILFSPTILWRMLFHFRK